MQQIINIGVSTELDKFLNEKIKISNQVGILMALIGVCYTVFSIYYYPALTVYPAFCILLSLAAISLNYLGLYNVSRFILSNLVILLAYIYHGFLVQPGETIIPSMIVIEFALSVIPWVLIDLRERSLLLVSLALSYIMIFSQPWVNDILQLDVDSSIFREGLLSVLSYSFAVLILVSCLFFMQFKNYNSEIQNEKLVSDINTKSNEMEKQRRELENHLHEIDHVRSQEEKQTWMAKGIADISDILRQDNSENIHDLLVHEIVKYIEANQGCIFTVNDSDPDHNFLEMAACYAYERKKYFAKQIEIGQGLIGQCYLERQTIKLKDVPPGFINITSGLGDALPVFVIIVPVMHEEKVAGVMEFALFHELENYQVEFLEKLSHNIASFLIANSMNIKTKELFEQSQVQMEQLRAQEEEMRQNMEELQATQEEMQRKENEYLDKISELENELSKIHV